MLNGCLGYIELPLFFIENVSYFFSPWQSSSKLDSAHGLSKKFQIFTAVHNSMFRFSSEDTLSNLRAELRDYCYLMLEVT